MESQIVSKPGPDPVSLLSAAIPEFTARLEHTDLSLPYVVFGFFSQYLQTLAPSDAIFRRAVEFLNAMAEMGSVEFDNLLQVAVFETIVGDTQLAQRIKAGLRSGALKLFTAAEKAVEKF